MTTWTDPELRAWAPPPVQTISEWADENRVLSPMVSAEPGPWRTARTPYLREIMDSFANRLVEQITLMKSTQVGGTEAFHNAIAWTVCANPVPIVLVMPRDADIHQVIARRIKPMFEASETMAREITGWAADWKTDELGFKRSVLYGRASNSAAQLASVAGGVLIGDETDKWPRWTGKEAPPWDLAKERTRTFGSRKIGAVSTPVLEDGLINTEFNDGDRRRFWVPCPHCGEHQVLEWDQVRWLEDMADDPRRLKLTPGAAWYECIHCGERIEDTHKRQLLAPGLWVPEEGAIEMRDGAPAVVVPDEALTDHRSYHLWAAYSPWLRWAELVATYLKAEADPDGQQNWHNSWLGQPYHDRVESPSVSGVKARIRPYARDTLPEGATPLCITAGIDVQKVSIPYAVRAWGNHGESWLLRAGTARSWEAIEELLDREWAEGQRIRLAVIDSRHRTDEVYDLARERADQVRAIKGVHRSSSPALYSTTKVDRHPISGRALRQSLIVWNVAVDPFRDRLAKGIQAETLEGGWQIHADPGEPYLRQLSAQEKVRVRKGSRVDEVWQLRTGHRVDDLFDCEVYNHVAANMIGVDRFRGADSDSAARRHRERQRQKEQAIREARERRGGGGYLRGY